MPTSPEIIISGGQTGVDRAAFDVAIECGIAYGGYVPKDRLAEDGPIPERYKDLIETTTSDPAERTELNVIHSDAILAVSQGKLDTGTKLTLRLAREHKKPVLHVDLAEVDIEEAGNEVLQWFAHGNWDKTNIAGPRESESPGIYEAALKLLELVFKT